MIWYAVGGLFVVGVLLADDELDKLTDGQLFLVLSLSFIVWPLSLGVLAGLSGLAGNKKD